MSYDDLIKFRSTSLLVKRLERIAVEQRRDLPDLLRIVLEDYAKAQEQQLGLSEETTPYHAEPEISSKRKAELDAKIGEFLKETAAEVTQKVSRKKKARKSPSPPK